jgi:hypothetical protein
VDLGSGSGLTAIAARLAGASHVLAADIDVFAVAAIQLNAAVNGVTVEATSQDLLAGSPAPCGVVLIGDLFYERQLAGRVLKYIDQVKSQGASIFIGDPQRNYFPRGRFERQADYRVPVCTSNLFPIRPHSGASKASVSNGSSPTRRSKNTSFKPGAVDIRWFEDGTLNVSANCIDRHLKSAAIRLPSSGKATTRTKASRSPIASSMSACSGSPTCSRSLASRRAIASPSICR